MLPALAAALAAFFTVWLSPRPIDWTDVLDRTADASQVLAVGDIGFCTAWTVTPQLWVSASHCNVPGVSLRIDRRVAIPIAADRANDLLLLYLRHALPVLKLAPMAPRAGMPVVTTGFIVGFGAKAPPIRFTLFSALSTLNITVDPDRWAQSTLTFGGGLAGMSGAAVVNRDGEVIGVHVGGSSVVLLGVTVPYERLQQFLQRELGPLAAATDRGGEQ